MEFRAPQNELTQHIIRCAIEVHRVIGPGLKEEVYEAALAWELRQSGHDVRCQVEVPVTYKGVKLKTHRETKKLDMLVDSLVAVELKATPVMEPVFKAQCLTYTRMLGLKAGLVLNFGRVTLKDGIARVVNETKREFRTRLLKEDPRAFRNLLVEEEGVSLEEAARMQRSGDLGLAEEGSGEASPASNAAMGIDSRVDDLREAPLSSSPASCLFPSCFRPPAGRGRRHAAAGVLQEGKRHETGDDLEALRMSPSAQLDESLNPDFETLLKEQESIKDK